MRRPVAEELPVGVESGDLLALALGALGCVGRLDALLELRNPAPAGARPHCKSSSPPDPALAALLGLVSLRRTLLRWLAAASAETPQLPERGEVTRNPWQNAPGGWLR